MFTIFKYNIYINCQYDGVSLSRRSADAPRKCPLIWGPSCKQCSNDYNFGGKFCILKNKALKKLTWKGILENFR